MKATDLLKEQHEEVASLFEAIEKSEAAGDKRRLFAELASKLCAHDAIERELFYPACKEAVGLNDLLGEALVEHGFVEFGLYLANEAIGEPDFDFKCKVLGEIVKHHVEEEENEFFPEVAKALGSEKLESLAEEMSERFEEATQEDYQEPLYENLRQVMAGVLETEPAADQDEDDSDDEDATEEAPEAAGDSTASRQGGPKKAKAPAQPRKRRSA